MSLSKRLTAVESEQGQSRETPEQKKLDDLKLRIHRKVVDTIREETGRPVPGGRGRTDNLEEEAVVIAVQMLDEEAFFLSRAERQKAIEEILDDVFGYGPIDALLKNDAVTEVMVNAPGEVYIERGGKISRTDFHFRDDAHVMQIIEKIVAPLGRRIDESSPMVDARLPDGSRVNAIIPPLALKGPCLTIRKFGRKPLIIADMVHNGTMTANMAEFLTACVAGKLNIMISGGTGSGKTTTLNALSAFIPNDERIVTIEDAAELQLRQDHVVRLETRPANIEGRGAVTIRDLVINALRMRPDRIVVGEVRGGEALDMLQAMNTGHEGSLGTAHANSPRDVLRRLETMVLMAGMDLPLRAIREQIAAALDLIVHQARLQDGSRCITHITEVQGMEGDVITLQDIFVFETRGMDRVNKVVGEFRPTGIRPAFLEKLSSLGINVAKEIFWPKQEAIR